MPEPRTRTEPLPRTSGSAPEAEATVPPFRVLRAVSENTRMMGVSLRELIAHKRWVFLAMAVACTISSWVYWINPPLYSSTVSFYVLAPPVSDKDKPIYLSLYTDPVTLRHIATSTAMYDHLIAKYDLQRHYGVPKGTPNERAILHQMLLARVGVDLRESEVVAVQVRDKERTMAAVIANEVFTACDSMLRAEQHAQLGAQVRVYDQVIDSMEVLAQIGYSKLMGSAQALKELRKGTNDITRNERAEELEYALMDAADEVASINHDLVVERRNHANLLVMARDMGSGPVRLRSMAIEDLGATPLWRSIQWIVTITVAAGVVSALLLLLIIETWMTPVPSPAPLRR